MKTSGRRSRAAAVSFSSILIARGQTRSDSIRPVTENFVKSPSSSAPARCNPGPPKPKISTSGTRLRSSVARAPAYRSPEASPQEIMIRKLRGTVEERVGNVLVERHAGNRPLDHRLSVLEQPRLEWHADAVDEPVVRKQFFVEDALCLCA